MGLPLAIALFALTGFAGATAADDKAFQSWETRSKGPDVVRAFSLDEESQRGRETSFNRRSGGTNYGNNFGIWWPTTPAKSAATSRTPPVIDSAIKPAGTKGSLQFSQPPTRPEGSDAHADDMGAWFFNAFPFDSLREPPRGFGANERFFLQWRQRFNRAMAEEFLFFARSGNPQGGIKQLIVNGTDGAGKVAGSSDSKKLVVQTYEQFRLPHIYTGTNGAEVTDRSLEVAGDFQNMRRPVAGVPCTWMAMERLSKERQFVKPPPSCFSWVADEWLTFQLEVDNRDYGPTGHFTRTIYRLWAAREGQRQELILEYDTLKERGPDKGHYYGDPQHKLGKFWFTPYMTSYGGGNKGTLETWIGQVILSRSFIPDPL
jgi:hypothetical protein